MTDNINNLPLAFAHIGDLHITKPKEQNFIDLLSIIAQIETEFAGQLDFVFLPGDNADNGLPEQYKLVATALKMLSIPVFIIPGDHDMEQGSLDSLYKYLPNAQKLPFATTIKGVKCLFADVSGPGKGGPDFRLGNDQLTWLEAEMADAKQRGNEIALFVHTYPADIKDHAEVDKLNLLIKQHAVTLVNMGHTHYNELANNGLTIFAATRSTGQIEEGPVGYSVVTINSGIVSWRFTVLQEPFPFVVITKPADYRLHTKNHEQDTDDLNVQAAVFGANAITVVNCLLDDVSTTVMQNVPGTNIWHTTVNLPNLVAKTSITVEAINVTGRPGRHTITLAPDYFENRIYAADGSDADSIGSWPENGIMGTQLGPNRNGKPS